jgi:hypothetical protein
VFSHPPAQINLAQFPLPDLSPNAAGAYSEEWSARTQGEVDPSVGSEGIRQRFAVLFLRVRGTTVACGARSCGSLPAANSA